MYPSGGFSFYMVNRVKPVHASDRSHSMDSMLPVQNKNFSGEGEEFTKILGADEETKVIYSDNSWEFGKGCEDLSWNHCTSTAYR